MCGISLFRSVFAGILISVRSGRLREETRGDIGPSRSILTPGFKPPPRLHPTFHGRIDILGHCNQIQQRTLFRDLTGFHARRLDPRCLRFGIQQGIICEPHSLERIDQKRTPHRLNPMGRCKQDYRTAASLPMAVAMSVTVPAMIILMVLAMLVLFMMPATAIEVRNGNALSESKRCDANCY